MATCCQTPVRYRQSVAGSRVEPPLCPGNPYIDALHVRAGCLYSKVRASRGRTADGAVAAGLQCDVCPVRRETLAHVIQQCPRSAHARNERHNAVAKLLVQKRLRQVTLWRQNQPPKQTTASVVLTSWRTNLVRERLSSM